jgi:hypothetical protein
MWHRILVIAFCLSGLAAKPAPVITAANLLDQEQSWPYRATLVEAWQPPGRPEPLRAGTAGVLIRVETGGVARIDFSVEGKYEVPIDETDLVANANRIRRGEIAKHDPNFVHAFGARLLDSAADPLTALRPDTIADRRGFLCVFADPSGKEFAELAAALRPLDGRGDTLTILFPRGSHPDAEVQDRLRAVKWPVPYLYQHLSEPYTRTLVREGTEFPAVILVSSEGRLLYQSPWRPGIVPDLVQAFATFAARSSHP